MLRLFRFLGFLLVAAGAFAQRAATADQCDALVTAASHINLPARVTFLNSAVQCAENVSPESLRLATVLYLLAGTYRDELKSGGAGTEGRHPDAEMLYKRSLAIRERLLGRQNEDVARSLDGLALLYFDEGRKADAEPLFQRSLAIREKLLGPKHDVARSLFNLALLYSAQGKDSEAEPLYKRSLAMRETLLVPGDPALTETVERYGELLRKTGRSAEAESLEARSKAQITAAAESKTENPTTPERRLRVGGDFIAVNLMSQVRPTYPLLATLARVQGIVVLEAEISGEGTVESLRVVSGDPLLTEAATDAVKQWRFKPILLNGVQIPVVTTIQVRFALSE